jgi:hypothetical protein
MVVPEHGFSHARPLRSLPLKVPWPPPTIGRGTITLAPANSLFHALLAPLEFFRFGGPLTANQYPFSYQINSTAPLTGRAHCTPYGQLTKRSCHCYFNSSKPTTPLASTIALPHTAPTPNILHIPADLRTTRSPPQGAQHVSSFGD